MTWREAESAMEAGAIMRRASWASKVCIRIANGRLCFAHRNGEYWPSLEATKATDWIAYK